MKIFLTYGSASGIGRALLLLGLFYLGLHGEVGTLATAQAIGMVGAALIMFACLHLALRARRAELPPAEKFGLGQGFVTGLTVALIGALFSGATNFLYFGFINPGLSDLIIRTQTIEMEAAGDTPVRIEQVTEALRTKLGPGAQAVAGFFDALVVGALLALVVAAYFRRPAAETPTVAG